MIEPCRIPTGLFLCCHLKLLKRIRHERSPKYCTGNDLRHFSNKGDCTVTLKIIFALRMAP